MRPFRQARQRHHGDFALVQQAGDKPVPRIFLRARLNLGDGEKFGVGSLARMASAVNASTLAWPGSRPSGKSLHESPRAVAPVGVVQRAWDRPRR